MFKVSPFSPIGLHFIHSTVAASPLCRWYSDQGGCILFDQSLFHVVDFDDTESAAVNRVQSLDWDRAVCSVATTEVG